MSECGKEICRVLWVRKTAGADSAIGSRGPYHGSCWATGFFSLGYTLCGRKVSRRIHISSPSDVTCRGCKRRWELAAGARELPRPAVNDITNRLQTFLRRT